MSLLANANNAYLDSSPATVPTIATSGNQLIMAWFRPSALTVQNAILQIQHGNNTGTASELNMVIAATSGQLVTQVKSGTLSRVSVSRSTPVAVVNTYKHFAAFFPPHDGATKQVTTWVDGVQLTIGTNVTTQTNTNTLQFLRIGEAPFSENHGHISHAAGFAPETLADANAIVQLAYRSQHPENITSPIAPRWAYSLIGNGNANVGGVNLASVGAVSFDTVEPSFPLAGGAIVVQV